LNKKGLTLVGSIMLIVVASIVIIGVTTFVIQSLSTVNTKQINTRCLYLAQAGIQNALYDYRFRAISQEGYFTLGTVNVNAENYFLLEATEADLLMVDTSQVRLSGKKKKKLDNFFLKNAAESPALIIDRMIVSWEGADMRKLKAIRLDRDRVWRNKGARSPVDADIKDFTLQASAPPILYPDNSLEFDRDMSRAKIEIVFVMFNGSRKKMVMYDNGVQQNYFNFSIRATGKVVNANGYRTLQAEYNALEGKVVHYTEVVN